MMQHQLPYNRSEFFKRLEDDSRVNMKKKSSEENVCEPRTEYALDALLAGGIQGINMWSATVQEQT